MNTSEIQTRKEEKGFTLVELAVVMIIIGLLIGGILKGQELIVNAQVTNAISQIKGMEGAVATFRDSYSALPGDMGNAQARLAGCTADPNCANSTTPNGRLDEGIGSPPASTTSEGAQFFNHLRVADLITGMDGTGTAVAFGATLPAASIGGGFFAGHTSAGIAGFTNSINLRAGHYITLNGDSAANAAAATAGLLTPSQAARIDRKIDDGLPESGTIHGSTAANCKDAAATPTIYNEDDAGQLCSIAIRIQG